MRSGSRRVAYSTAVLLLLGHARADAPVGRYTVANGAVYDTKTKLTWQQSVATTTYQWSGAKAYCSGIWRLPTARELASIVDDSRINSNGNPAVDPTAFPSTPSSWFWSSTASADGNAIWAVHFATGEVVSWGSGAFNVRCVR